MSIRYNIHVGAYVVCRGPEWLGPTPNDEIETFESELVLAHDMTGRDIVEGAWVFVRNGPLEHSWSWSKYDDCPTAVALPCKGDATAEVSVVCEAALDVLYRLFRSVEIREGIITWAD